VTTDDDGSTTTQTSSSGRVATKKFRLLCERAPGVDWATQRATHEACDGTVYPDLRTDAEASTTRGLAVESRGDEWECARQKFVVQTIAGSRCGSMEEARVRAVAATRSEFAGGGALLCVTGDGDGAGTTSEDLLREMAAMRNRGEISKDVALFAAVNPMLGAVEAERMARKRDAGCDGFVSQPSLLPGRFSAWQDACDRLGVIDDDVDFFLGVSTIRSVKSLEFWYRLTGIDPALDAEAAALRAEYARRQSTMSPEIFDDWTYERVELAAMHALSTPRVSGAHLMPVHASGYEYARRVAESLASFRV
jgi:hypothetical protein